MRARPKQRGERSQIRLFGWLIGIIFSVGFHAPSIAAEKLIEDIQYTQITLQELELRIQLNQAHERPLDFTTDSPPRIALDFANTRSSFPRKSIGLESPQASSLQIISAKGRSRVVVNLYETSEYFITQEGDSTIVRILNDSASPAAAAPQQTPPPVIPSRPEAVPPATVATPIPTLDNQSVKASPPTPSEPVVRATPKPVEPRFIGARKIMDIDFRRSDSGGGKIMFSLSSPDIEAEVRESQNKILVEFNDTYLPDNLIQRMDVMDFGTPVRFVDAMMIGKKTRILIDPKSNRYDQLAYQSDDLFVVEINPPKVKKNKTRRLSKKKNYSGERLSLNFQDIEVRSVLQLLADFTGLNIVVSDTVSGNLTLRLKNVPWDHALDIILKSKSLDKRKNGNVVLIAPSTEIAAREQEEMEVLAKKVELAPLVTEYIQVNYAKAKSLATILRKTDKTSGVLSDRGSVSVDERTNTLLVTDTEDKLVEVQELVRGLDIPVRQVLIESRIVVATDDFNKELGVRFGVSADTLEGARDGGNGAFTSGTLNATDQISNGETVTPPDRFNVNLPTTSRAGSIALALAKLPLGSLLELELSAMQAEGKGEVISSPRVITSNQKEAFIEQGVEVPYLEASSSGAATISFRKAVLGLKVRPHITPDDRIIMDLTVNKDSVGEMFGEGRSRIPSIDTREVSTQVLVSNGETVVLGGIYEQEIKDERRKVPFFADIPFIGRFFRSKIYENDKTELLVFVTPKIVRDQYEQP